MPTKLSIVESPIEMIEGEAITFLIDWEGASSITEAASVVYLESSEADITSAVMPTATGSDDGVSVQTLGELTAQADHGGNRYILIVTCTVDGNTEKRKLIINIIDPKVVA